MGHTVQWCKRFVLSREFSGWRAKFRHDEKKQTLDHLYFAQICQQVAQVLSTNPSAIKYEDFLFHWEDEERDESETVEVRRPVRKIPKTDEEKAAYIAHSKSCWAGFLKAAEKQGKKGPPNG